MRSRFVCAFAISVSVGIARADYVEVRRALTIRAEPSAAAIPLATPAVGTRLVLLEREQVNGYYHVRIPSELGSNAAEGYVFRNRVRGFPGDPPGTTTIASSGEPTAIASAVVYGGIPRNQFPEFPITVLDKGRYVVGYCEDFLNPAWVFYHVGAAVEFESFPRPPRFATDRETNAQVNHDAYTNSGFDRGHMAPNFALGSRFGAQGARSTFVMSNICPQFHTLNDGQWGDLEEWIAGRKVSNGNFISGWADTFGGVWVVVGPLFDADREPLESGVPVPNAFFCIVVDEQDSGQPRSLAFIMPHVDQRVDSLDGFLTTIDEIEQRSGLDFFGQLSDGIENELERTRAQSIWTLPVAPN